MLQGQVFGVKSVIDSLFYCDGGAGHMNSTHTRTGGGVGTMNFEGTNPWNLLSIQTSFNVGLDFVLVTG